MYASQLFANPKFLDDYPAGVSITTTGLEPVFVYVNPELCRMTGYRTHELIGRSPKQLQGPLTDPIVLADLKNSLLTRQPWYGATVNYRRDGTPFQMEWIVFPIYDEADRLINWGAIQHEVSEQSEPPNGHIHARNPQLLTTSYFEFLAAYEHTLSQLALELHDNVGQQLLLLSRRLAAAAERTQRVAGLRHELAELTDIAHDLSQQLRHVMHKARPQALGDFGVFNAIEDLARRLRKASSIEFTVSRIGEKRRLPPDVETNLYRILQEALSNIVKHSGAQKATVNFLFLEHALEIAVADDGRGLPAEAERSPGIGLRSMALRASGIGADFQVTTLPKGGTQLHISLPLRPATHGTAEPAAASKTNATLSYAPRAMDAADSRPLARAASATGAPVARSKPIKRAAP